MLAIQIAQCNRSSDHLSRGPKPIPILGNLHQLQPILSLKVAEFADMYGPIFPLHFGKTKKWIIADADYVEAILHMPRPMEGEVIE